MHREVFKRLGRFAVLCVTVFLFFVSANIEDAIKNARAFVLFVGVPSSWLGWLTVETISPVAHPIVLVALVCMAGWTIWPVLHWVADHLELRKLAPVTIGLGLVVLAAGGYLIYRGMKSFTAAPDAAPSGQDQSQSKAPPNADPVSDDHRETANPKEALARTSSAASAPPPQQSAKLLVECTSGTMARKMPADGRLHVLSLFPTPEERGGGGLAMYTGEGNSELKWSNKNSGIVLGIRCDITNYGPEPLIDVRMDLAVNFVEAIPRKDQPGAMDSGKTTLRRLWPIQIVKIEPGEAGHFTFWAMNTSDQFATFDFPDKASAQPISGGGRRELELLHPNTTYLSLPPNQSD